MRAVPFLAILLLVGCDSKEKVYSRYVNEVYRANLAYAGSDADAAYAAKQRFVEYVEKLQADNAPIDIPFADIYIWENARLGLLAEHLGKKDESKRYFSVAVDYAKKRYPNGGGFELSEAGLRSALDQMDTSENIAWRKK
jgi:hypothetical protein